MKFMVLGFMFDPLLRTFALIRKEHPEWQKGLLNGVGGQCNFGEDAATTMVREFREEAGLVTKESDWTHYSTMIGDDWMVDCFYTITDDVYEVDTLTDEKVLLCTGQDILDATHFPTISNIPWLIQMAKDHYYTTNKFEATITYTK